MKKVVLLLAVGILVSGCAERTATRSIADYSANTKAAMSSYPTKDTPVAGDKILITDSEDAGKTKNVTAGTLPVSTPTSTAISAKANASCFESEAAFNACFALDWSSGSGTWGSITGTLSNQTDLSNALAATTTTSFTGSLLSGVTAHSSAIQSIATELDNAVEITAGTNVTITAGVIDVKTNTYQPLDSDLTTAAGAGTAGNSKYFGTNSSGSAGFHDLPTGSGFSPTGNWQVFYSNGSATLTELPIGLSGTVLKSNGPSSAPSWQSDATGAAGTGTGNILIDCGDATATTCTASFDGGTSEN